MIEQNKRSRYVILAAIALVTIGAVALTAFTQTQKAPIPDDKLVLGEKEIKQLLLLMDTDKNGKISKAEYIKFMEAEFERLDKDKSGELDPKELAHSSLRASHFRAR